MVSKVTKIVKTIDTGDIWQCPVCHRKYHLLHRVDSDGKILKHDFEECIADGE